MTGRDAPLERVLKKAGIDVVFENAGFYGGAVRNSRRLLDAGLPASPHAGDVLGGELVAPRHGLQDADPLGPYDHALERDGARRSRTLLPGGARARPRRTLRHRPRCRALSRSAAPKCGRHINCRRRYFYLPNQFWRHKNHRVVVRALAQLRGSGVASGHAAHHSDGPAQGPTQSRTFRRR